MLAASTIASARLLELLEELDQRLLIRWRSCPRWARTTPTRSSART